MKTVFGYILFVLFLIIASINTVWWASVAHVIAYTIGFRRARPIVRRIMRWWGNITIRLTFSSVKVIDKHNFKLAQESPCLVISNHLSILDAPLSLGYYDFDHVTLAKSSVIKYPFIGSCLKIVGYPFVKRGSVMNSAQAVLQIRDILNGGMNLIIYPEGTRMHDGQRLGLFKSGSFTVLKQIQCPILPLLIYGSNKIYNSNKKWCINPGKIYIKVLDPIMPHSPYYPDVNDDKKTFTEKVNKIQQLLSHEYDKLKQA